MRGKLTYANVMSSLAVFLVLGGVAWAAKTLPRNSVGTAQLKADAVVDTKVADGDLNEDDFAPGSLRGARGAKGAAGDPGAQGPAGDAGPPGERGASCVDLRCSTSDREGRIDLTYNGVSMADLRAYKTTCVDAVCRVLVAGTPAGTDTLRAWAAEVPSPAKRSMSLTEYAEGGDPLMRFHLTDAYPVAVERFGDRVQVTLETAFLQRISV